MASKGITNHINSFAFIKVLRCKNKEASKRHTPCSPVPPLRVSGSLRSNRSLPFPDLCVGSTRSSCNWRAPNNKNTRISFRFYISIIVCTNVPGQGSIKLCKAYLLSVVQNAVRMIACRGWPIVARIVRAESAFIVGEAILRCKCLRVLIRSASAEANALVRGCKLGQLRKVNGPLTDTRQVPL